MPFRKLRSWGNVKPPVGSPLDLGDPINNQLVGCLLLNEGCGLLANDVARPSIGVLTGFAVPPTNVSGFMPGRFGPAPVFDGTNDYIASPLSYTALGAAYSISVWLKETLAAIIVALSFGGNCILVNGQTILRWQEDYGAFRITLCAAQRTLGLWYHLVITSSGTGAGATKMYYNGIQNDNGAASGALTSGTLDIGREQQGATRYWGGMVDNVRLYNRVLNASECRRLYTEPFAGIVTPRRRIISQVGVSAVFGKPLIHGQAVSRAANW